MTRAAAEQERQAEQLQQLQAQLDKAVPVRAACPPRSPAHHPPTRRARWRCTSMRNHQPPVPPALLHRSATACCRRCKRRRGSWQRCRAS